MLLETGADTVRQVGSIVDEMVEPVSVHRNTISGDTLSNHPSRADLDDITKYRTCLLVELSGGEFVVSCIVGATQTGVIGIQINEGRYGLVGKKSRTEKSIGYDINI